MQQASLILWMPIGWVGWVPYSLGQLEKSLRTHKPIGWPRFHFSNSLKWPIALMDAVRVVSENTVNIGDYLLNNRSSSIVFFCGWPVRQQYTLEPWGLVSRSQHPHETIYIPLGVNTWHCLLCSIKYLRHWFSRRGTVLYYTIQLVAIVSDIVLCTDVHYLMYQFIGKSYPVLVCLHFSF